MKPKNLKNKLYEIDKELEESYNNEINDKQKKFIAGQRDMINKVLKLLKLP